MNPQGTQRGTTAVTGAQHAQITPIRTQLKKHRSDRIPAHNGGYLKSILDKPWS